MRHVEDPDLQGFGPGVITHVTPCPKTSVQIIRVAWQRPCADTIFYPHNLFTADGLTLISE